jgi:hypothetical protein
MFRCSYGHSYVGAEYASPTHTGFYINHCQECGLWVGGEVTSNGTNNHEYFNNEDEARNKLAIVRVMEN